MAKVNVDDVMAALDAVDYPAGKWDLVEHAERAGAADEVVRALRGLPLGDYASREEVRRSVPVNGPEPTAEQRRDERGDRGRIAEAERDVTS